MTRHRLPRARRGAFLLEAIIWLSIIAAISVLLTEMMVTGLRIHQQSIARDTLITRVDSALDLLRRDAWSALSIQTTGTDVAFVRADRVVLWRMEPNQTLTRLDPAGDTFKKSWIEMPAFSFTVRGPLLDVQVASGPDNRRETVTLPSQPLLAGGAP